MNGKPLPVFPWTNGQVEEVADALCAKLEWPQGDERSIDLSHEALKAAARVMWMDSQPDPMGAPRGYGWRSVRATTGWYTVAPDETWKPGG